ncbi:MAG TPA: sulfotransferase [Candidatus Eremiobacteraceae bacterium]|nr:sulfotransferase [Candidatus Eremiobacteraceae bacterium]
MPTLKGLSNRLRTLRGQLFINTSDHHRDSILIAAMQRSGTTWLSDIINFDGSFRSMYEPFHNRNVPQVAHFHTWQYLRPTDDSPRYVKPAADIFEGRIRNPWISAYNTRIVAGPRIIKDVRSLMMIGWIHAHWPEMPIVLLIRHPCAVLNSLLRLRWHSNAAKEILSQPQLMEDHLEPFRADIQSVSRDVDDHLLAWCANYYVALRQLAGKKVFVAFYERILSEPHEEIPRLFSYLGRPIHDRVFTRMAAPSVQARVSRDGESSAVLRGGNLVTDWRQHITQAEIDRAMWWLRRFGLDDIYGPGSMPLVADLSRHRVAASPDRSPAYSL